MSEHRHLLGPNGRPTIMFFGPYLEIFLFRIMKIMTLLPSTLTFADTNCPPIELTVGDVIGKTVDVPYIGQFCQYVGIPYAEPPKRWLPSVRLQTNLHNENPINSIHKRPPCPDIGRENLPESCLYFDIYMPIGPSPI